MTDVVIWNELPETCNRCNRLASRYINPYWRPQRRLCPQCCRELNDLFDRQGWPPVDTT